MVSFVGNYYNKYCMLCVEVAEEAQGLFLITAKMWSLFISRGITQVGAKCLPMEDQYLRRSRSYGGSDRGEADVVHWRSAPCLFVRLFVSLWLYGRCTPFWSYSAFSIFSASTPNLSFESKLRHSISINQSTFVVRLFRFYTLWDCFFCKEKRHK